MMLRTRLCELLGIAHPIVCAPMGWITGPELTAAVSGAGGLGILGTGANPPELLRQKIRRARELTDRPFGVNLILSRPAEERFQVCIEERIPVLSLFWGDPAPFVERAHDAGMKVLLQVGDVASAIDAKAKGVDAIIAQGVEAGGHIAGELSTMVLVPRVVDAVAPVPVIAAGGVADARGLVAVLALGAQAAVLGTRFIATPEADAHPEYKRRILAAGGEDTVRTTLFGGGWQNAPHRVLRTGFVEQWLAKPERGNENRPDEPVVAESRLGGEVFPIRRFMVFPPNRETTGAVETMALYAGQSAGLVREQKPAGQIVAELMQQATELIRTRLARDN
jgi:NAD(P)H-dependent flavin oxidoreductase YrpB (nitropropane dioxygenase family)